MAPAINRLDPVFEAPVTPVISPSGVTNSTSRPKSPRTTDHHKVKLKYMGFFAAEHFSAVSKSSRDSPQLQPTPELGRTRGRAAMGTFGGPFLPPQFNLSDLNCKSKNQTPRSGEATTTRTRTSKDTIQNVKSSAFLPALSVFARTDVKEISIKNSKTTNAFPTPADMRRSFQDCTRNARSSSPPKVSSIRGCMNATTEKKRQLNSCAVDTFNIYENECESRRRFRGRNRGADRAFFVDAVTEAASEAPVVINKVHSIASSLTSATKESTIEVEEKLSPAGPCEETIRERTRRYPDAALIKNPIDARLEEMIRQSPVEEDPEFIPASLTEDESPKGLRQLRLQLFQNNHNDATVPKARLSRALTELSIQDGAILNLQQELNNVSGALDKSQETIRETEEITQRHEKALNDLKTLAEQERRSLEIKLLSETEENAKLHGKVNALQVEMSRLRTALRTSKTDLAKQSQRWTETRAVADNRSDARLSFTDTNEPSSPIESAILTALKAEVIQLKSQLANVTASQSIASNVDTSPNIPSPTRSQSPGDRNASSRTELVCLRLKLSRAEHALSNLKSKQQTLKSSNSVDQVEKELVEALAKSREETARAVAKEGELRKSLDSTMTELENIKKFLIDESKKASADRTNLSSRLAFAQEEAERASSKAMEELNELRNDAEELRIEVTTLTEQLTEARQEAKNVADERASEKAEFVSKLHLSSKANQALSDAVEKLKAKVARAEVAADESPATENEISDYSQVRRNVKRRIDDEVMSEEINSLSESPSIKTLIAQLEETRGHERSLRGEVFVLKGLLKQAEARVLDVNMGTNINDKTLDKTEQTLSSQVDKLSAILASHESRAMIATEVQDVGVLKARETALDAEVMFLRACLESAEAEIKEEKARAEVERGIAKGNELKMREEMKKLELEIENSHDKKAERELQGKVALLRVQLKTAEGEVSRVRNEAVTHALRSDLSMSKLSSEMGLMSAKLSAAHKPANETSLDIAPSYISNVSSLTHWDLSPIRANSSNELQGPYSPPKIRKLTSHGSLCSLMNRLDEARSTDESSTRPLHSPPSNARQIKQLRNNDPIATVNADQGFRTSMKCDDFLSEIPRGEVVENIIDDPEEKCSTLDRFDIDGLQARMRESSKRLTDATFKLKGLVIASDELKDGQKKTQARANHLSAIANRLSPIKDSLKKPRIVSPDEKLEIKRANTPRTNDVLEKYRKYKESRMSPDRKSTSST